MLERIDGIDLKQVVERRGPLPWKKAAESIRQAGSGLAYAHAQGFVHRDIKPANLMIDKHGVLRVLDLGLARRMDEADSISLTLKHDEKILGSADYLSPEQGDRQSLRRSSQRYIFLGLHVLLLAGRSSAVYVPVGIESVDRPPDGSASGGH